MNRSKASRTKRRSQADSTPREPRPEPRPGTVTALQSQVHDPDRVSMFIDGTFAMGIARDVAEAFGLHTGQVLDEPALAQLTGQETLHRATATALTFLAYRPRSEGEIRQRLRRNEHTDEVIEQVLERLRGWRYVDDADFSRRWIENRAEHRPRGTRLLSQELRAKGVDPNLAAEAIDEAEINELDDALALARDRLRQLGGLDQITRERRLSGFLGRRGYGFDVIRETINQVRTEEAAGTEPEDD